MKELNVLHIASFNGNIGDNANHNGFRYKLKETLNCEIKFSEIEMREFYKSWNSRNFNSKAFIDLCNIYDLVIIGGGNFFELKWDYSSTGTTINIEIDTLKLIKTPIFFFGLGCDIAKGSSQSNIIKFAKFLDYVTSSNKYLVTVRNDGSLDTIKKLFGDKYSKRIFKVADGAFFHRPKPYDYPEVNKNLKSVGINIVSDMKEIRFRHEIEYDDFILEMAQIINTFLEENIGYQIILFPHIYSDLEAIYKLLENVNDRLRRTKITVAPLLTGKGSEQYIFGLYNKCEVILGMRFHTNVCAISQNIPTIALSSYKKIYDLYSELNLLDRIIYVNKKGFEKELLKQLDHTLTNIEEIKSRYREVNENIEIESNGFYKQMKEWINPFIKSSVK